MPILPTPQTGDETGWVREHLGHLTCDDVRPSSIRGGQGAADAALATLDLAGYARRRSQVLPESARGATRLSPYIRHGLLTLPQVWAAAGSAPPSDRTKFRDELLWQEYARHLYARLGTALAEPLRTRPPADGMDAGWPPDMACMSFTTNMLETDGWLVNQTRMWLASQWTVRQRRDWREGEDAFFTHLLDGSRAANRLGWQWTTGAGSAKPYGFSRWQVEKRAPQLCRSCPLKDACPVDGWPDAVPGPAVGEPVALRSGVTDGGPTRPVTTGEPDAVWLTAESLGTEDPARLAHPDVPTVFVFDEPLLARLRLSGKRLVFLAEALAEVGALGAGAEVRLGDPVAELAGRRLAVTHAPVPGFRTRRAALADAVVVEHPWPWLRKPGSGSLRSFTGWARP